MADELGRVNMPNTQIIKIDGNRHYRKGHDFVYKLIRRDALSVTANRFLDIYLSHLRSEKATVFSFTRADYESYYGIRTSPDIIKAALEELTETRVIAWDAGNDSETEAYISIMSAVYTKNAAGQDIIALKANELVVPSLLDYKNCVDIPLHVRHVIKNKYAFSLYDYLADMAHVAQPIHVSVNTLRQWLGIPDGRYQAWRELNRRVICPAVADINNTNLHVEYTANAVHTGKSQAIDMVDFYVSIMDIQEIQTGTTIAVSNEDTLPVDRVPFDHDAVICANLIPFSEASFVDFWKSYPRKRNYANAMKIWESLNVDQEKFDIIMASLEKWNQVWSTSEKKYIMYPDNWLKKGCYMEEPEMQEQSQSSGDAKKRARANVAWMHAALKDE